MPSGQNGGLQEMPVFSIVSPRVRGVGSERYSPVHRTSADIHLCLGTWDFGQCVSSSNGMNMHRRCSDTRIGPRIQDVVLDMGTRGIRCPIHIRLRFMCG